MFGNAEETFYGLGILPALMIFGTLGITTVIASIDDMHPVYMLPGYSLLRSMFLAGAWPNLGRLTLGGAALAVPIMLVELLHHWFAVRGIPAGPNIFWSGVPIDALTVAPFQAFFTYLYLDFKAREDARR